jgi:hypothetical protein
MSSVITTAATVSGYVSRAALSADRSAPIEIVQ